jgi:hypothetical protein
VIPLTEEELSRFTIPKTTFSFFEDGLMLKVHYQASIWYMDNGTRREFPNWSTFLNMGGALGKVRSISEGELGYIPIGPILPNK